MLCNLLLIPLCATVQCEFGIDKFIRRQVVDLQSVFFRRDKIAELPFRRGTRGDNISLIFKEEKSRQTTKFQENSTKGK